MSEVRVGAVIGLVVKAKRIPAKGDMYINKNGAIQRCMDKKYSNHAQKRHTLSKTFFTMASISPDMEIIRCKYSTSR